MTGRIGMVFALVAVLGLLLLIPIHHGHALHDALASIASGQTPEQPHHSGHGNGSHPNDEPPASFYCPVCVLGKAVTALVPPAGPVFLALEEADGVGHAPRNATVPVTRHEVSAQPRAPPFPIA